MGTPPDMSDLEGGEFGGGEPPQGEQGMQGESVTFTLTDETVYTDENGDEADSSIVTENAMLTVVLNENNEAVSVTVSSVPDGDFDGEGGFGGAAPDGDAPDFSDTAASTTSSSSVWG